MARQRSFVRGASRISAARRTSWLDIPLGTDTIAGGGVNLVASLTAAELARRPFTIERTHLWIHITSDQLAADEFQFGAVGMAVVSDQALAIGVTAVPTPVTDLASDLWFLHQIIGAEFTLNTAVGFDANGGHIVEVDSRAKRKVNDGQDVIVVAELAGISFGALVRIGGRLLIKEG